MADGIDSDSEGEQPRIDFIFIEPSGEVTFDCSDDFLSRGKKQGGFFTPIIFRDFIAWVDEAGIPRQLQENRVAGAVVATDGPLFGPVIITGPPNADGSVGSAPSYFRDKISDYLGVSAPETAPV